MKNKIFYLFVTTILVATSCDQSGESAIETSDSTTTTAGMDDTNMSGNSDVSPYLDLKTNSPVYIDHDSVTHAYVNRDTRQPLSYYYDPITKDTFDARGRIVNNALVLTNGDFTIDEAKVKSNDDAFKAKYEHLKVKAVENSMKIKDEDIKIKAKDDKY